MDIIATFSLAKEMGLEVGQIASMLGIYFLLRRDLLKVIDTQFDKLIKAINALEKSHNERLNKIETHVGLKKE